MTPKTPIPFCSFGGYRRFCGAWWNNLLRYACGVYGANSWNHDNTAWWRTLRIRCPGWCCDIYTYWHRARYGWAPRDTWNLSHYWNKMMGESLLHLANSNCGCPANYVRASSDEPDFERWNADLHRWGQALLEDPDDVAIYDTPDYKAQWAEETRRQANLHVALRELEAVWESLWN